MLAPKVFSSRLPTKPRRSKVRIRGRAKPVKSRPLDSAPAFMRRKVPRNSCAVAERQPPLFGWQMRFDSVRRLPLLTTKSSTRSIIHETCCGFCAATRISVPEGQRRFDLGRMGRRKRRARPVHGKTVAQLGNPGWAQHRPDRPAHRGASRRTRTPPPHRVGLEPVEIDQMALPPCHALFQFYVAGGKAELPALPAQRRHLPGVPFNIASYALSR